jgi:DNA polymerase III epsilon subunit-like protein
LELEEIMSFFVNDVEADGPAPALYSMVSFGVVRVDAKLDTVFSAKLRPITSRWDPESLAISGVSREEHLTYDDPAEVMTEFVKWVVENSDGPPIFISDNPAFDWQFMNYYLHAYTGANPFGHSARRIGDVYGGVMQDLNAGSKWRELIRTKATHDPVVDAIGNAEAFLALIEQYGLLQDKTGAQPDLLLARAAGFEFENIEEDPPTPQMRRLLHFASLVRHAALLQSFEFNAL